MKMKWTLLVLILGVLNHSTEAAQISCQQAKQWVDDHAQKLPSTLSEMNGIHVAYRREILNRLDDNKKISLWKEHLNTFRPTLTDAQRAELDKVLQLINTKLFAATQEQKAKLIPTREHLYKIFGEENTRKMFTVLGSYDPAQMNDADMVMKKIKKGTDRKIATYDSGLASCNCNAGSDFCASDRKCGAQQFCDPSAVGCGWLWLMACNGSCNGNES